MITLQREPGTPAVPGSLFCHFSSHALIDNIFLKMLLLTGK